MYEAHYGLRDTPFAITPDTSYFFPHASHQETLNTLLIALRSGEGFIKVVGEVGTGKTLLCRKLLAQLEDEGAVTAYVPNPYLEPSTLLLALAEELAIVVPEGANQHQLLKMLNEFLIASHAAGKRVVFCLDEAQALPVVTLEALRLLTNLETESSKLVQVVLFGQPELDEKLDDPSIRQLKQRITFSSHLGSLNLQDTEFYIAHRLSIGGYRGPRLFARDAVKALHRASRGVPRLINILANKALIAGFGEGAHYITSRFIAAAIEDTESVREHMQRRAQWQTAIISVLSLLAVAGLTTYLWTVRP
jgi:MSHA biogenesis protein MshM